MKTKWPILALVAGFALAAAAFATQPPQLDAAEIVRKSLSLDRQNFEKAKDYIYQRHVMEKRLDGSGKVKSVEERTYEQYVLYGEAFERLTAKNGKPLSDKNQQKEDERLEKAQQDRQHETPAEKQERLARREKRRQENRAFVQQIPEAFNLRLTGSEVVNGRDTWVIEGEARPDFKPKTQRAQILSKMRCKFWVDKSEYQWVKAEAEMVDNFTFWGGVLAKLNKGTRLEFEQQKVNDEIWLPKRTYVIGTGRLLLMSGGVEQETIFSDYRKFRTDSRILSSSQ